MLIASSCPYLVFMLFFSVCCGIFSNDIQRSSSWIIGRRKIRKILIECYLSSDTWPRVRIIHDWLGMFIERIYRKISWKLKGDLIQYY